MADKPPLHQTTNTSTWVDELYAKRLARQDLSYVGREAEEENPLNRLRTLRDSRIYLREEMVRGPGVKKSVRAYFVDLSLSGADHALSILHCDYDPRNGRVRRTTSAVPVHIAVTKHALERLHERLRTNALGDVYRLALRPLSRVPPPVEAQYDQDDMVLHLAGFGILPVRVVGAIARQGVGTPCWGVLTYIDRAPNPNECIVHTIGPEQ